MVSSSDVHSQLKRLGVKYKYWGRAEIRELPHILVPGERIEHVLNGRYEGGFALICATNIRLLLIDKKPFYLTLEDIRYDMITEVDYSHRLVDSTVTFLTFNKTLSFTSFRAKALRALTTHTQQRVMDIRQYQSQGQQVQEAQPQIFQESQPLREQWQPQVMVGHEQRVEPVAEGEVSSFNYNVINPYTKMPLMMRRRVPRFYQ